MSSPQINCRIVLEQLPGSPGSPGPITIRIKVVPGASRTRVVGLLGDRLKVAVAAPPQAGQANKMLCKLLAKVLQVSPSAVTVIGGQCQPRKVVAVTGLEPATVAKRLGEAIG